MCSQKKDLAEEEAKKIIESYTSEEFVIEMFEVDKKSGETIVIVKFTDKETAGDFVRTLNEIARPNDGIKYVRTVTGLDSFSLVEQPVSFYLMVIFIFFRFF